MVQNLKMFKSINLFKNSLNNYFNFNKNKLRVRN